MRVHMYERCVSVCALGHPGILDVCVCVCVCVWACACVRACACVCVCMQESVRIKTHLYTKSIYMQVKREI